MKVQFTNEEMTEAVVTKGILWWKKEARVCRGFAMWYHENDTPVEANVLFAIYTASGRIRQQAERTKQTKCWRRP